MSRMNHVIRVSDMTFKELIKQADWSDTMNDVISRLLDKKVEEDPK